MSTSASASGRLTQISSAQYPAKLPSVLPAIYDDPAFSGPPPPEHPLSSYNVPVAFQVSPFIPHYSVPYSSNKVPPPPAPPTSVAPSPKSKRRQPRFQKDRNLDRIDELDESSPMGFGMHHRGPYDALPKLSSSLQAGYANRSEKTANTSLNLSPGDILDRSKLFIPESKFVYPQTTSNRRPLVQSNSRPPPTHRVPVKQGAVYPSQVAPIVPEPPPYESAEVDSSDLDTLDAYGGIEIESPQPPPERNTVRHVRYPASADYDISETSTSTPFHPTLPPVQESAPPPSRSLQPPSDIRNHHAIPPSLQPGYAGSTSQSSSRSYHSRPAYAPGAPKRLVMPTPLRSAPQPQYRYEGDDDLEPQLYPDLSGRRDPIDKQPSVTIVAQTIPILIDDGKRKVLRKRISTAVPHSGKQSGIASNTPIDFSPDIQYPPAVPEQKSFKKSTKRLSKRRGVT